MDAQVTVFRSADETASEDAAKVHEMLTQQGIAAVLVDDRAPGVPFGAFEVRVAPENQARAEQLIAQIRPDDEFEDVDPSEELDTVTVFQSAGTSSEMEATTVQSLLESNDISAIVVGDSRFPNLPEEVRVAKEHAERARELILEAQAAGPAAAEEAEAMGEQPS